MRFIKDYFSISCLYNVFFTKKIKNDDVISASTHETKQASTNLPDDLIFTCILPLLSYKSLSKFKCVNKTWYNIISYDAKFAYDQSLRPSPLSCGAVFSKCFNNKIEFFDIYGSPIGIHPRHRLHVGLGDREKFKRTRILASACGLLCLLLEWHRMNNQYALCFYYVCNLATMEGDVIDPISQQQYDVGLAFDPIIDPHRYKLVRPTVKLRLGMVNFAFSIYSSDNRGWVKSTKEINIACPFNFFPPGKPVTLKNVVYWDCLECVVSFDPWKDNLSCISLPVHLSSEYNQELGTWNELITCTRMDKKNIEVYAFKKKWEKMYSVVLNSMIDGNHGVFKEFWHMMKTRSGRSFEILCRAYNVFPFPYEGGGRLFFRMHTRKTILVLSYDLKSKKVEKLHESQVKVHDKLDMKGKDQKVFIYHNSMVRMPTLRST